MHCPKTFDPVARDEGGGGEVQKYGFLRGRFGKKDILGILAKFCIFPEYCPYGVCNTVH